MKSAYNDECVWDLEENSIQAKKLEAFASELYALSCYGDFIHKQAFVTTATGDYLNSHGIMRDCHRKYATSAYGNLTFSISSPVDEDINIQLFTICSSKNDPYLQFETIEEAVLKAGETSVEVPAMSLEKGEKYNVLVNEVTVMVNAPVGIESVYNSTAFTGGTDDESDESYRNRIKDSYATPHNGYNKKSIENRINQLDYILDCAVLNASEAGNVSIVVIPSDDGEINSHVDEIRDCVSVCDITGCVLNIKIAKVNLVSMSIDAYVSPTYDLEETKETITEKINKIFSEKKIGNSISVSKIMKELLSVEGVEDANIFSNQIINGIVFCDSDSYLKLHRLEVNAYET